MACWQLYGEVLGYEAEHLSELGRFHQLMVDAYGAQHAGGPTPRIATAFGLIGLHLALEEGMSGIEIRAAHQHLARHFAEWPAFARPTRPATLTVSDVAAAGSPEAHADLVQRWARSVWSSWDAAHERVATLVAERLPADVRGRLGVPDAR